MLLLGSPVSFEQGEFCSARASGSGKSTAFAYSRRAGIPLLGKGILHQGEDLFAYNDNQLPILRRRRFGFVFQAYNLVQN